MLEKLTLENPRYCPKKLHFRGFAFVALMKIYRRGSDQNRLLSLSQQALVQQ
jgi:hypothetical protein